MKDHPCDDLVLRKSLHAYWRWDIVPRWTPPLAAVTTDVGIVAPDDEGVATGAEDAATSTDAVPAAADDVATGVGGFPANADDVAVLSL